jgi:hypothetical protein
VSRNLKRVPMTFDWPLRETWGGYVNPYYERAGKCPDCVNGYDRAKGRPNANAALFSAQWYGNAPFDPIAYGADLPPLTQDHPAFWRATRNVESAPDFYMTRVEQTARDDFRRGALGVFRHDNPLVPFPIYDKATAIEREARRLYEMWRYQWCHHLIQADVDVLVAEDRLWALTSTWSKEHGWKKREDGHHPTATEVNVWSCGDSNHDNINKHICVQARCVREGVPHTCTRCRGTSKIWSTHEIEQQCKDWQKTDPPTGEGYQLWEDCSEGSPISPVFAALDDLCEWAAEHATTFGPYTATADEWKAMLDGGFVHAKIGDNVIL